MIDWSKYSPFETCAHMHDRLCYMEVPPFWFPLTNNINNQDSGLYSLRQFVRAAQCSKWAVFSDYVFNDANKKSDVISFAVIPYYSGKQFDSIRKTIKEKIPHDLKHYESGNPVPEDVADAIASLPHFGLSFRMNKKWHLYGDKTTELCRIRIFLQQIAERMLIWANNASNQERRKKDLRTSTAILKFLSLPEKEWKLPKLRQVVLVALLTAAVRYVVAAENGYGCSMWGTDRDSVFDWPDSQSRGTIYEIEEFVLYNMLFNAGVNDSTSFFYAEPPLGGEKPWYDLFNRLADYLAGTFAFLDTNNSIVPGSKCNSIFERYVADNPNVATFIVDPANGIFKENTFAKTGQREDVR